MLQELWAKISARERFIVYGAALVALGVIVGLILGSKTYGGGSVAGYAIPGVSVNYFTAENAGLFALLALVAAIVTLVAIYLRYAPNVNFTWPAPYGQILIGAAAVTAACAVLIILMQLIRAGGFGPEPPIFLWVADLLCVAGAVLLGWSAYQEWTVSKANPGA